MTNRPTLRPYQSDLKSEIKTAFTDGIQHVILSSPTGSGKTVTFADIARDSIKNGARVMIAVDRAELLKQSVKKLTEYGLRPSIITAGRTVKQGQNCYVATVQTLVRRKFPEIDLLIIDEAHKQIFDKLLSSDNYGDCFVIGATATPKRTGKMKQLGACYDKIIEGVTIKNLISLGFLTPAITYGAKLDKSSIKISRGDYDAGELYKMFDKRTRYSGVVDKYIKFANKSKAICFNVNVEHSKKVTHAFNAMGISSRHLDGTTSKAQREAILDAFSKGYFKVLNNVDVLTTGYDEFSIETVIVNRATKSLPLWLQMCGRGSRIVPKGFRLVKDFFNIIDMGGNVFEHGFWESDREYSLKHKSKEELGVAPVKDCPESELDIEGKPGCGAIVPAPATVCKYCAYIFPPPKKEEPKDVEFIQLENYDLLPAHLIGKSWGSMTVEELEKVRVAKGYAQGWIIQQILMNKDLELIDYARFKQYKHGARWVERMNKMYIKQ